MVASAAGMAAALVAVERAQKYRASPVFKPRRDIRRFLVIQGSSFLFGGKGKQNAGRFSWNLSLECLHDSNRAECNFGLEMKPKPGSSMSRNLKEGLTTAKWSTSSDPLADHGQAGNSALRAVQGVATTLTPKSLPGSLWVGIVALLVLVGLVKLNGRLQPRKGQAVKTRILRSQWFDESKEESSRRNSGVRMRTPIRSARLFRKSETRPSEESPAFKNLVIHDGQVVMDGKESSPLKRRIAGSENYQRPVKTDAEPRRDRPSSLFQRNGRARSPFVESSAGRKNEESPKIPQGRDWSNKDETDLKQRIEELRKSVLAAETNRKAAMRALAQERQRSLELEVKISRQKEAAISLEEEVRVLKESHEALLNSLRKKYSSSVAARAAAALLYQNWEDSDNDLHSVP